MTVLYFPAARRLPAVVRPELKREIDRLPTDRLKAAERELYEVVRWTPLAGLVALWFEVNQQLGVRLDDARH